MRLKVGDDFLDGDQSTIAQTYAVNEIGSIETRQGGFSNNFTIPLTAKNKAILGFPDDINTASRNAYTKVDATLFDQAVPVAEGYLRFKVVENGRSLETSFFADNVNWFNLLKGKKLKDLDLSAFDHNWDTPAIKAAIDADKTSGYTYPMINYGTLNDNGSNFLNITQIYPAMFFSTLLTQIFFDIGWKADGSVLNHSMFKRMILPFSAQMNHSAQWVEDETISDTANATTAFTTAETDVAWPNADVGGTDFTITQTNTYTITIKLIANITAGTMDIKAEKTGAVSLGTKRFANWAGNETKVLILENISLEHCTPEEVTIVVNSNTGGSTGNVLAGSTISIEPSLEIFPANDIQMAEIQPDMLQTDFLQFIAFFFGAVLQANTLSKTVTWSFFRDIKNNLTNAVDWSNKIDFSKTRKLDFTELINNYSQTSIMTWQRDPIDTDLEDYEEFNRRRFGEGQFDIDNEHLIPATIIYTSPFAPTINVISYTGTGTPDDWYIPSIPFFDSDGNKQLVKARVLLISKNIVTTAFQDDSIGLNIFEACPAGGELVAAISFSWFAKQQYIDDTDVLIDSMAFDQVNLTDVTGNPSKDRFLESYEEILNSIKFQKSFVALTDIDIANLDFTVPVYIDRFKSYFYISQIKNFEGSIKTTEVDLVKIA